MDTQLIFMLGLFLSIVTVVIILVLITSLSEKRRRAREETEKYKSDMENKEIIYSLQKSMYAMRDEMKSIQENVFSSLSDNRKYIEEKLYKNSEYFTRDSDNFLDSNRVILDTNEPSEMLIHNRLPDFSFFEGMAIDLNKIQVNDKMVACLMPFNPDFDETKYTIAEACLIRGYSFRRSDDVQITNNNDLRKSIIQMILEAKIVVAVLDGRNPNVYYEIGIAHSMGKLVLMVVNMNESPAFDVSPNRLITYKTQSELKTKLIEKFDAVHFAQQ